MDKFNVTLPNGVTLRDIPVGTSREEIKRKAVAAGLITEAEFEPRPPQQEAPLEDLLASQLEAIDNTPTTATTGPEEQAVDVRRAGPVYGAQELTRSFWGGLVLPAAQAALDFRNMGEQILRGGEPIPQEKIDQQQATLLEYMRTLRGEAPQGDLTTVVVSEQGRKSSFQLDERGRVTTQGPETFVGMVLPYLIPGTVAYKAVVSAPLLAGLSEVSRIGVAGIVSSVATGQLLTDPYAETVANALDTYLTDQGKETIFSYLATDEEDPMYVRRIKMAGQDTILGVLIDGGIIGTSKFKSWLGTKAATSGGIFRKAHEGGVQSLNEQEAGEFFYDFVKDIKAEGRQVVELPTNSRGEPIYIQGRPDYQPVEGQTAGVFRPDFSDRIQREGLTPEETAELPLGTGVFTPGSVPTPPATPVVRQETDEGLAQIAAQSGSGLAPNLRRLYQQVFTSQGYWTETLFGLRQQTDNNKRAIVNRAEGIARRINISLDRLVRDALDPTNPYQLPFETDREGAATYFQEQVGRVLRGEQAARSRLPEHVLDEIDAARSQIDSLSMQLVDSPTVFEAFKDDVLNNVGSYLKRSYEIFENPNYVANREPATNYFYNQFLRDGLDAEAAMAQATARVDGILANAKEGYATFLTNTQVLNNNIFASRNRDIPAPIRQLLGEITDPSRDVVLTVTRLANFVETDKFLRGFGEIGQDKFIFDEPTGLYSKEIKNTNSPLDGMYTTPELYTAITNQQSKFEVMDSNLFKTLATYKATTQTAKTVLSHVTHVKNFLGGTMTRMANGSMPFTRQTANAFRVVYNNARGNGDKGLDDLAEEYIRLGVINTSTDVRELRDLIDRGYGDPEGLFKWATERSEQYSEAASRVIEGVGDVATTGFRGAEKVYMGVDDFFKIAEFEDYASVLQRAYPDMDSAAIREMAAKTIKDTMFNYDMVPNAIKSLRYVPFGSFVGFPAEVLRTSINIPQVAFREINSGNTVLAQRGWQRLIGWGATVAGGGALVTEFTARINGMTEDEIEALREYHRTPWSDNPTPWVSRDLETGELLSMDGNTIDTYQYFREPFQAILQAIADGTATEDSVMNMAMDGAGRAFKALTGPFLSESMATEAWSDFITALKSEDGRGASGKLYFETADRGLNTVWEGMKVFFSTLEPGSFESVRKGLDEGLNDVREWQGDPTEPDLIVAAQFGLPLRRIRPENALAFGVRDFANARRNIPRVSVNYRTKPEEVIDAFKNMNQQMYQAQRELRAKALMATSLGMDWADVHRQLTDGGLDDEMAREILDGNFIPSPLGQDTWDRIQQEVYHQGTRHEMSFYDLRTEISRLQDAMHYTTLDKVEGEPANTTRLQRNKGGLVSVPNAPALPSTRIDKYTGMPYDLQAGGSYVEDDPVARLMRAMGGPVNKSVTAEACAEVLGGRKGYEYGGLVKRLKRAKDEAARNTTD